MISACSLASDSRLAAAAVTIEWAVPKIAAISPAGSAPCALTVAASSFARLSSASRSAGSSRTASVASAACADPPGRCTASDCAISRMAA